MPTPTARSLALAVLALLALAGGAHAQAGAATAPPDGPPTPSAPPAHGGRLGHIQTATTTSNGGQTSSTVTLAGAGGAPSSTAGAGAAGPAGGPTATVTTGPVYPSNTTEGVEPSNTTGEAPAADKPEPPSPAPAATPSSPVQLATAAALANDAIQLNAIAGQVGRLQGEAAGAASEKRLSDVRQDAAAAQASADAFARARLAEVSAFDQQLKRLEPRGRRRPRLSPADQALERDLRNRRAQAEGLAQKAEAAASTASGVYNAIANQRRNAFAAHIFERTASPLETDFWSSLASSLGPDTQRLGRLVEDTGAGVLQAPEPRGVVSVLVALGLAALLVFPGLRLARRALRRKVAETDEEASTAPAITATHRQEASRDLGRAAHALATVLLETVLPGLAAVALNLGLTWGQLISDRAEVLADAGVRAVFWGAAVVALSRQLAGDPDERLLPVSERLASHMRALPWLVALITGAGFLLNRINVVVGASVAATIAANCLVSLAYAAVASLVLLALGGERDLAGRDADVRQPGRMVLSLALTAAILLTVGAVLAGFTTFAALVARQIFWISVVGATAYLLLRFVDDGVARLFAPRGWFGRLAVGVLNLRMSTVDQLGVLVSAVLQVTIVLATLTLVLTPFGASGDAFAPHMSRFGQVVHVGSIAISPVSLGAGLASLLIGLALVHVVERWVDRRYLPVTDWDSGVRNSVSTGVRYLGVALAILWALAAAGLGFKQIALVASALSVGIGFGLQQIVQNFVSGLILLVERPVKVGDWVNLGSGIEGDVQRIRVRATEIRTFDRTTVIVPNSDLITKQVQNKTLGDPRGRVRLEISVGAATDAPRALEAIQALLVGDEEVLSEPEPRVYIDSLTSGGSVNYVCFAYVASPRDALRVKSRLYAEVLALFADQKIGFIGGPTTNIMEPSPALKGLVEDFARRLDARALPQAGPADPVERDGRAGAPAPG